jgi:enediyne biosynthesis protein E4
MKRHCYPIRLFLGLAALCILAPEPALYAQAVGDVPVTVTTMPLTQPAACAGAFVGHELDHTTTTADGVIRMYEANGSGLAIGDLDNDGDLDLVLGSETGPNSLLWNEGGLRFRKQEHGPGLTRAITIVDVDADGWRDLVLTRNTGVINYWRNTGNETFVQEVLPGVALPAYALGWGDLDLDSDLDLVTASYDAGLLTDLGNNFLLNGGGGVVVYENRNGRFVPTKLANEAQGLALALTDFNADGRPDVWVGNDFHMPDRLWLQQPAADGKLGWQLVQPFVVTSNSTMSVDWGNIGNNGELALFTSDMNPYDISVETLSAWLPVMATLEETNAPNDPQRTANMLQLRSQDGVWRNEAARAGVEATGWSWAGRFGDLDNDGWLDLYVVNGMIEARMFKHLPNHELVEENQVFRNDGSGRFVPMPAWGLNSTLSGRSMGMADFDGDGDLEIVVNNLRGPAMLYENGLCGDGLQVELQWSSVQNRDAIGAQVILHTGAGMLHRDVRAASGYLTGDAARLHFGLPGGATVERLEIHWPDGASSVVGEGTPNTLMRISR